MFVGMNNLEQGDLGESIARCWYELHGHVVFIPTGRSPDYDFVADDGERLIRVQVKTSGSVTPYGRWAVSICTRGGNQSWSGLSKRFSADRCDELFVVSVAWASKLPLSSSGRCFSAILKPQACA